MIDLLLAIGLTLSSGVLDAFGFVHASRVWRDDHLIVREAFLTFGYFLSGVGVYLLVVRYFDRLGVASTEIQTLLWFAVTVIGVASIQRSLADWSTIDRAFAVVAAVSVGWLVARHG